RTSIDRFYERLKGQRDVRVGRRERNRKRWQRANEMRRPDGAARRLFFAAHEQVVGAARPTAGHGHTATAAEQVELNKVCETAKVDLTFAVVKTPALCAAALVRGRE